MTNKQLMNVSNLSKTAERVLKMIAQRQRNTVYTAFSGLRADLKKRDGSQINKTDFDSCFLELEKLGAGTLDVSKRGVLKGFTWSIPIRKLGTILKNKDEVGKPVVTKLKSSSTVDAPKKVTVVIIRKNKQPETIETDEKHLENLL